MQLKVLASYILRGLLSDKFIYFFQLIFIAFQKRNTIQKIYETHRCRVRKNTMCTSGLTFHIGLSRYDLIRLSTTSNIDNPQHNRSRVRRSLSRAIAICWKKKKNDSNIYGNCGIIAKGKYISILQSPYTADVFAHKKYFLIIWFFNNNWMKLTCSELFSHWSHKQLCTTCYDLLRKSAKPYQETVRMEKKDHVGLIYAYIY